MKILKVEMTPEWASELLAANTNNRHVSQKLVDMYAKDMQSDNWAANGDAIRVSKTGVLLDGQHRLLACLQSKKSFTTVLVTDLYDEVRSTIDIGRKRTLSDELSMMGKTHAGSIAAAARMITFYLHNFDFRGRKKPTNQELLDNIQTLQENQIDLEDIAHRVGSASRVVPCSIFVTVFALSYREHSDVQQEFANRIGDGVGLPAGDPRLALRNTMANLRSRPTHSTLLQPDALRALTLAWNAWITNRPLKSIRIGGQTTELYLRVEGAPPPGAGIAALLLSRKRRGL